MGTAAAAISSLACTFDPSIRAASAPGTEGGDPGRLESVDEPGDQRRLRADHDQVDALGRGSRDDSADVLGAEVEAASVGGDPGVAGRTEQLRRATGPRQRLDDRVLPPAASYDQDSHLNSSARRPESGPLAEVALTAPW